MTATTARTCPACGSVRVTLVPRGFVGKTDTADQYSVCQQCGRVTYEIVSVSQRDIRLYRYELNGRYERDEAIYTISRVLKVGFDEFLLYVRPVEAAPDKSDASKTSNGAAR